MGGFPVGRFLDNWEVGSLQRGQNGWEMKTSVSLPDLRRMSTRNDPEIRQTISNTAKLLSCFTPFGRFGPNILFCQQLWTHNSANPPTVGHGNFVGGSYCIEGLRVVNSYILRTASSLLMCQSSHLSSVWFLLTLALRLQQLLLPFSPISGPSWSILDYQGSTGELPCD